MFRGRWKIKGCFKRVFSEVHGIWKKFKGIFREVFNVFQGSLYLQEFFWGASTKFIGCFKIVSRVFQGRLKGVSMEFQVGFKSV